MPKYVARDTVFSRATSAAFTTIATIANVKSITPGLGSERGLFDQSTFGDEWMDWGSGQKDGDEFTLKCAYDPLNAVHVLLKSDYDTGVANTWIRAAGVLADWGFNATTVIKGWRPIHDRQGNLEVDIIFKIVNPGVAELAIP